MPAYEDDGGVIGNSLEIMRYIDDRIDDPKLFPDDVDKLEEVLAWMNRADEFAYVSHHLYWQVIEPPKDGTDWDEVADLKAKGMNLLAEFRKYSSGTIVYFG